MLLGEDLNSGQDIKWWRGEEETEPGAINEEPFLFLSFNPFNFIDFFNYPTANLYYICAFLLYHHLGLHNC